MQWINKSLITSKPKNLFIFGRANTDTYKVTMIQNESNSYNSIEWKQMGARHKRVLHKQYMGRLEKRGSSCRHCTLDWRRRRRSPWHSTVGAEELKGSRGWQACAGMPIWNHTGVNEGCTPAPWGQFPVSRVWESHRHNLRRSRRRLCLWVLLQDLLQPEAMAPPEPLARWYYLA